MPNCPYLAAILLVLPLLAFFSRMSHKRTWLGTTGEIGAMQMAAASSQAMVADQRTATARFVQKASLKSCGGSYIRSIFEVGVQFVQ